MISILKRLSSAMFVERDFRKVLRSIRTAEFIQVTFDILNTYFKHHSYVHDIFLLIGKQITASENVKRPYKCDQCGNSFTQFGDLSRHRLAKHGNWLKY